MTFGKLDGPVWVEAQRGEQVEGCEGGADEAGGDEKEGESAVLQPGAAPVEPADQGGAGQQPRQALVREVGRNEDPGEEHGQLDGSEDQPAQPRPRLHCVQQAEPDHGGGLLMTAREAGAGLAGEGGLLQTDVPPLLRHPPVGPLAPEHPLGHLHTAPHHPTQ